MTRDASGNITSGIATFEAAYQFPGPITLTGMHIQGNWKLIPWLGEKSVFEGFGASGGFTQPSREAPQPGGPQGQLYNLADDPGERENVYAEHPEIVQQLTELLERYRRGDRSRPN